MAISSEYSCLESSVAAADRFNQLADGQPTEKGLGNHVQVYPVAKGLSRFSNGQVYSSLIRHRHARGEGGGVATPPFGPIMNNVIIIISNN